MIAILYPGFGADDLIVLTTFIVIVLLVLVRFFGRDPNTKKTRFGFFIERERYDDEEPWPDLRPPEDRPLPTWVDKTAELPPKEEEK